MTQLVFYYYLWISIVPPRNLQILNETIKNGDRFWVRSTYDILLIVILNCELPMSIFICDGFIERLYSLLRSNRQWHANKERV